MRNEILLELIEACSNVYKDNKNASNIISDIIREIIEERDESFEDDIFDVIQTRLSTTLLDMYNYGATSFIHIGNDVPGDLIIINEALKQNINLNRNFDSDSYNYEELKKKNIPTNMIEFLENYKKMVLEKGKSQLKEYLDTHQLDPISKSFKISELNNIEFVINNYGEKISTIQYLDGLIKKIEQQKSYEKIQEEIKELQEQKRINEEKIRESRRNEMLQESIQKFDFAYSEYVHKSGTMFSSDLAAIDYYKTEDVLFDIVRKNSKNKDFILHVAQTDVNLLKEVKSDLLSDSDVIRTALNTNSELAERVLPNKDLVSKIVREMQQNEKQLDKPVSYKIQGGVKSEYYNILSTPEFQKFNLSDKFAALLSDIAYADADRTTASFERASKKFLETMSYCNDKNDILKFEKIMEQLSTYGGYAKNLFDENKNKFELMVKEEQEKYKSDEKKRNSMKEETAQKGSVNSDENEFEKQKQKLNEESELQQKVTGNYENNQEMGMGY